MPEPITRPKTSAKLPSLSPTMPASWFWGTRRRCAPRSETPATGLSTGSPRISLIRVPSPPRARSPTITRSPGQVLKPLTSSSPGPRPRPRKTSSTSTTCNFLPRCRRTPRLILTGLSLSPTPPHRPRRTTWLCRRKSGRKDPGRTRSYSTVPVATAPPVSSLAAYTLLAICVILIVATIGKHSSLQRFFSPLRLLGKTRSGIQATAFWAVLFPYLTATLAAVVVRLVADHRCPHCHHGQSWSVDTVHAAGVVDPVPGRVFGNQCRFLHTGVSACRGSSGGVTPSAPCTGPARGTGSPRCISPTSEAGARRGLECGLTPGLTDF